MGSVSALVSKFSELSIVHVIVYEANRYSRCSDASWSLVAQPTTLHPVAGGVTEPPLICIVP